MKNEMISLDEAIRICCCYEERNWNDVEITMKQLTEWLCELRKLRKKEKSDRWIPLEEALPEENTIVNVIVLHHEWISDYGCDWVLDEEKEKHPAYMNVTAAKYVSNGEFMCLDTDLDDAPYFTNAFPEDGDDLSEAIVEVLAWRPLPEM